MLLFQRDYEHYLQKYLAQTRVIHLHGVKGGKDHLSLAEGEGKDLEQVFSILKGADYDGVLTLEVFSRNDYQTSMEVVRQLWPANTN
jgi:sugar phosphate isomerase/epimerase